MSVEHKNFGEVFEGKAVGAGIPQVTLRRLTEEDEEKAPKYWGIGDIGIFHGADLIAIVGFDDIFDAEGNRFYND